MGVFRKKNRVNRRPSSSARGRGGPGRLSALALAAALAIALAGAAVWAAALGVGRCASIYREQCVIEDMERDVEIVSGKMIHPDNIIRRFGLKPGANLAEIPFAEHRAQLLESLPQIKSLVVTRTLPNRVRIEVVEREPAVRLTGEGRVADSEGVVFDYYRNTAMLPKVSVGAANSDIAPGKRLNGMAAAALRLVLATLKDGAAAGVRVLEADATHNDYLLLTLANYSRVKFAWDGMDANTAASEDNLRFQLKCLSDVLVQTDGVGVRMYNATVTGRVTAMTP